MSDWVDRHSVNCGCCSKLFDEREDPGVLFGGDIEFSAGSLCPACRRLLENARDLKNSTEELLHLVETPGDFTDHERLCAQIDAISVLEDVKGGP